MPAGNTETIIAWKSKVLSNDLIKPLTTANNSLSPKQRWHNSKIRVGYKGSYLKHNTITFTPGNVVNLYMVYRLDT